MPTPAQMQAVRDMLAAGASLREAGRAVGLSHEHVRRLAMRHGWRRAVAVPGLGDGEIGSVRMNSNGCPEIRAPWHSNADRRGYVPLARYVMSQALGRPLHEWEHVRHLDGDVLNNDVDNLDIVTVVTDHNRARYIAWLQTEDAQMQEESRQRAIAWEYASNPRVSAAAVAARHRVSRFAVRSWAFRYFPDAMEARPETPRNPRAGVIASVLPQAVERVRAGESVNRVATDLGVNAWALTQAIRRVEPDIIQPPRKRYIPDDIKRAAVRDFYLGMSGLRVAAKYGVSEKSVRRWAEQVAGA